MFHHLYKLVVNHRGFILVYRQLVGHGKFVSLHVIVDFIDAFVVAFTSFESLYEIHPLDFEHLAVLDAFLSSQLLSSSFSLPLKSYLPDKSFLFLLDSLKFELVSPGVGGDILISK